jgi:hypothetical protein
MPITSEDHPRNIDEISQALPSVPAPMTPALPIPALADDIRHTNARLVVTTVDRDGRLADRSPVTYVGWSAGTTVQQHVEPGPVIVVRAGEGIPITRRDHVRLSLQVRRQCRIAVSDRLLVIAHQHPRELLVVLTATVDTLVTNHQRPDRQARP